VRHAKQDLALRQYAICAPIAARTVLVASACLLALGAPVSRACAQDAEFGAQALAVLEDALDIEAPGHVRLAVTPGMVHWNRSPPEPYKHVWGVAVERQRDDGWLYGASYFSNSFGQDSAYVYLGRQYPDLFDMPQLFWQWSVGVLYGYKGQYADRVSLNYKSFAPGVMAALGWRFDPQFSAQINVVGDAGLMLQLSYDWR
jgi:hypothetical protein